MKSTRARSTLATVLLLGLMLMLATSGLAQTRTPTPARSTETPTPPGTAEPTEASEPAPAEEVQPVNAQDVQPGIELTVYNQNVGLVKEVRTLDLEAGDNVVRFADVAAMIEPTSVNVVSLTDPEGMAVLEQNYEYDLVNSSRLLQRYIDEAITVRTTEGTTIRGTLLWGADDLILATADGVRVIKLGQVQEFSFPELPEGLITRPTLVWLLRAAEAGEQDVRVTYLTQGITWQADYVALLNADDTALALNGWVTLDNHSGAAYRDARLKLVAGDINRVGPVVQDVLLMEKAAGRPAATPQVEERAFFEYHLYEVQRPVTVQDRQTKQIEFASAPEVEAEKVFVYSPSPQFFPWYGVISDPGYGVQSDTKVQVRVEFVNAEESGLGLPLPRGTVRVYKEDVDGGAELVGEDLIDHTPRDEELSLYLGDAFDIVGERVQTKFRQIGERSIEESYEITIRNHKAEQVVVRVIEHLFRAQDAEITDSSAKPLMLDATTARWDLTVPADGEVTLTYTVLYRW
ncbi:MAG TPA: DUF4139 domain-containing protein [Chloroflexi bacterium]|nr:DUF4139 domain-containing protein [Chloroflexota bacterium]